MKKTRIQPALATLSREEKDQLADWLRKADYLDVLERVRKPRSEGGFGLIISKKPLQTFYAKVMLLDAINARLPDDKKMTITDLESIANAERLLATSETNSAFDIPNSDLVPEAVYTAIMDATYDLATSGDNTPTQLLSLQRLADFPARADYRAHKVALDLRRETRQSENDLHRKHITAERLNLAKKSFELRERLASEKSSSSAFSLQKSALHARPLPPGHYIDENGRECDDLGPLPKDLDDGEAISQRARKKFGIRKRPDPSASAEPPSEGGPESPGLSSPLECADTTALSPGQSRLPEESPPSPLPPFPKESVKSAPSVVNSSSQLPVTNEIQPQLPLVPPAEEPLYRQTEKNPGQLTSPSFASLPSVPNSPLREAPDSTSHFELRPSDLVVSHAVRRWRAHIPRPEGTPEPDGSWRNECPCGKPLPCADHPELYSRVRYYKPQHPEFVLMLKEFGVPYYIPTAEELGCSQEALDKSRDLFAQNPRAAVPGDPRFDPFQNLAVGPAMQPYKDRLSQI